MSVLPMFALLLFGLISCKSTTPSPTGTGERSSVKASDYKVFDNEGFMEESTFIGVMQPEGWNARNAQEQEVVKTIKGLDFAQISELGLQHFSNVAAQAIAGNAEIDNPKIHNPKHAEAWLLGSTNPKTGSAITAESINWDKDSHEAREANPFMSLRVGNQSLRSEDGVNFKVDNAMDYFVDVYYDTENFDLEATGMILRSRVRYDTANVARRILIQAKKSSGAMGDQGLKSVQKFDQRWECYDSDDCWRKIRAMDATIKTGKNHVDGTLIPSFVMAEVFKSAPKQEGKLRLHPKAVIFSQRARYHMNLSSNAHLRGIRNLGIAELEKITASSSYPQTLISKAQNLISKLQAAGVDETFNVPPSKEVGLKKLDSMEIEAEDLSQLFHEVADELQEHFSDNDLWKGDKNEANKKSVRILEAAGSVHQALFLRAVEQMFERDSPKSGELKNYIETDGWDVTIDTFDFQQAITPDHYENNITKLEAAWANSQGNFAPFTLADVHGNTVFFSSIVNEVQIEISFILRYQAALDDPSDPRHRLAKLVLEKYNTLQEDLANRRKERVLDIVEERFGEAVAEQVTWGSADGSKGELVLQCLPDRGTICKP